MSNLCFHVDSVVHLLQRHWWALHRRHKVPQIQRQPLFSWRRHHRNGARPVQLQRGHAERHGDLLGLHSGTTQLWNKWVYIESCCWNDRLLWLLHDDVWPCRFSRARNWRTGRRKDVWRSKTKSFWFSRAPAKDGRFKTLFGPFRVFYVVMCVGANSKKSCTCLVLVILGGCVNWLRRWT